MKCIMCQAQTITGTTNYEYRSLPGVVLLNMPTETCPDCGEEYIGIPALEKLDAAIQLTGKHARRIDLDAWIEEEHLADPEFREAYDEAKRLTEISREHDHAS